MDQIPDPDRRRFHDAEPMARFHDAEPKTQPLGAATTPNRPRGRDLGVRVAAGAEPRDTPARVVPIAA